MIYSEAIEKASRLVSKMTVEEAASQLKYNSPAIERLGINEHNWWNEALHGVARAGTATVFPQAIGMAATFDPELIGEVADVISTEARAKYNQNVKFGDRDIYKGLTFWSPNINIFRDPRWGRGQETFGEDPYLTSVMGCAFVKGIQGEGEFLKAVACAKHYAVHSGPEKLRHGFNVDIDKKELWETYLPAFDWTVNRAKVRGVMGAYSAVNGEPCCVNEMLLGEILMDKWNFEGYVVSDCGAIADIHANHRFTENANQSAALALKRGCNLNCGNIYENLIDAYEEDLIEEEDIRSAAVRLMAIRYLLGEFEENRPYSDIPLSILESPEHKALNYKTACESLVLLKNENNFLPLNAKDVKKIAVIGPNCDSITALEGNYNGRASEYITVADAVRAGFPDSLVQVAEGSQLWHEKKNDWGGFANMISGGAAAAATSDVAVLCLGLDCTIEGEEGCVDTDYSDGGDKRTLYLPDTQQRLAEAVCDNCENVIVVLMAGSSIDLGEKVRNHAKAIIGAWYPGAVGGKAVCDLIKGVFSPSGRLPVTFYYGDSALPEFTDYSMQGRTYRYLDDKPLYPFGYGLSYTSFEYSDCKAQRVGDLYKVSVKLMNTGDASGTETVQVYAKYSDSRVATPKFQLCGTAKVSLAKGEQKTVEIDIDGYWVKAVDYDGERIEPDMGISLYVGGHQPDERSDELCGSSCVKIEL